MGQLKTTILLGAACIIGLPRMVYTQIVPEYSVSGNPGVLTVKVNGLRGSVCAQGFGENDAKVICRSLKLPYTDARPLTQAYTDENGPVVMNNLECFGNETSLEECPGVEWGVVPCPTSYIVRIYCNTASEGGFRLLSGTTMSAGRVEYYHKGEWGLCDDWQDLQSVNAPQVLCQDLGLPFKMARFLINSELEDRLGRRGAWIEKIKCNGTESSWRECNLQIFDYIMHGHGWSPLVVSCEDLRLVRGTHSSGSIEGYFEEEWRKVFSQSFDSVAASVACRVMGRPRSGAKVLKIIPPGSATVSSLHLSVGNCDGDEMSLAFCYPSRWLSQEAGHVEISCEHTDTTGVKFRLSGGPSKSVGLLEVYHDGRWGNVCNVGVDPNVVAVACKTLGLSTEDAMVISNDHVSDPQNTDFILSGLACKGFETNLADCDFNPWGVGQCYSWNTLAINCGSMAGLYDLRLAGGDSYYGRLEIYAYRTWYRACFNSFYYADDDTARSVCQMLGLPWRQAKGTTCFDGGTGPFWRQHVQCRDDITPYDTIEKCFSSLVLQHQTCIDLRVICSDEEVDDKNCLTFTLPSWSYALIVIAGVFILIFTCATVKRKVCRKQESSGIDNVPPQRYVVRENGTENQEVFNLNVPPPQLSDPPPSYDELFKQ